MVCATRLRIMSRDKGEASDLSFSNFKHTLDKGPITESSFLYFSRISSIAEEFFLFFILQ